MALLSLHCNAQPAVLQLGFAIDQKLQWALPLLKRPRKESRTCQFKLISVAG